MVGPTGRRSQDWSEVFPNQYRQKCRPKSLDDSAVWVFCDKRRGLDLPCLGASLAGLRPRGGEGPFQSS